MEKPVEESMEKCRQAYDTYRSQIPWLSLTESGLGCRICMAFETKRKKSGLASGTFVPGRYLYKRTFLSHETSCRVHGEALACESSSGLAPQECEISRAGAAGNVPSTPTAAGGNSSTSVEASPTKSSKTGSDQRSPSKSPFKVQPFLPHVLAGYTVCQRGWSSSVFSEMIEFGQMLTDDVSGGHDGPEILSQIRDMIWQELRVDVMQKLSQSPALCVSIDEKDAKLVVLLTYLDVSAERRETIPVAYHMLPGLEASDVADVVKQVLQQWGVCTKRLVAMAADGASLNGTMRSMENISGKNVAAELRKWVEHPLVTIHCAAHRLNLAVSAAYKGESLHSLESVISTLFRHVKQHPACQIDLQFWSEVTSEPLLSSLAVAKTRWLSQLAPMKKLYRSFNAVLAHLHYAFSHHCEKESKKTVRWMFLLLCSWPTKVLLAAVVDILSLCSACKNSLEGDISLDEVATSVSRLKCELARYCEKESVSAYALATDSGEVAAGKSKIEECCAEYRAMRGSKLRLRYDVTGGSSKEYWCEMKDLGSPADIRELFRTIRSFAEQTMENLVVRFGDVPLVLAHQIFSPRWSFKQPELVESAKALATFWKVDEQVLVSQLRAAFAIRDSLISEDSTLKTARSKEVWLRVLSHMTSSESDAVARDIIASFLVIQPQSAACERAFATVEEYKKHLGCDSTAPLLQQQLLIGACARPVKEARASGFIKRVLGRFSATERRTALRRRRAPRSDKGKPRPNYKRKKRVAQLTQSNKARLLVRSGDASVQMVAADNVQLSEIYAELSPPKKKKKDGLPDP
ncbi:unnamed protein product [Symbiodinium sp. CCMP2592]|nr:unnamed protein product [Symbiodinium sp. CCMP2592]